MAGLQARPSGPRTPRRPLRGSSEWGAKAASLGFRVSKELPSLEGTQRRVDVAGKRRDQP